MKRLSNKQKGFGIVELLFVTAALCILVFIGWAIYQRKDATNKSSVEIVKPEALLYGYFDNLSMKVSSFDLMSSQKEELLNQAVSEPDTRNRSSNILDAKISSNKHEIAYRFKDELKVKMIKNDGSIVSEIPRDDIYSFDWMLNSRKLILEISNYIDCNGANCEAPIGGFGSDWLVYDVDSGMETKLDTGDSVFNKLEGQTTSTIYFSAISPYGGISPTLYAYDLESNKVIEIDGLGDEGIQIDFVSTSPGGKRTIISILPPQYGVDYSCTIYELRGSRLGKKIIDNDDFKCESAHWIDDDEFYFDNSTGPNGRIDTSHTSASGYYILFSVFKYSFLDKSQQEVLLSDGAEIYILAGSLPDGSFIVLNQSNKRDPRFKLEIRYADGSLKTTVDTSQKEIWLIGSVK